MQRQLFAQCATAPLKATSLGPPSDVSAAPATASSQDVRDSVVNTKRKPKSDAAVVDLTTGADDATRQSVTGDSSAPSQVEERLLETTVHTSSIRIPMPAAID